MFLLENKEYYRNKTTNLYILARLKSPIQANPRYIMLEV